MSARTTRIILFAGSLALCVLLFIAPRSLPKRESAGTENKATESGIGAMEIYRRMAVKSLAGADADRYEKLGKAKAADSLVTFWLDKRRPDLAAMAAEEKAMASSKAADFFDAGNRYYNSVRFSRDESERPALFQSAIRCFRKGLEKDPDNVDAKIMLASCYVEGSSDPMKGISLLKEVERTDSNNVKLQLSFAFFSVESGQLDRAAERFRKVLAIDSNYIEAYLHLADVYQRQGEIDTTVQMLTAYARRTSDPTAKIEVNKYIQQLQNKATIK